MKELLVLIAITVVGFGLPASIDSAGRAAPEVRAPADEERALAKSVTVAAPVAEAWRAWTTSAGMKEFMGANSNIELKFGGRFELLFDDKALMGLQGSEGAQVLSYVPEKMLSFSWNAPPSMPAMRNQRTFVVITFTTEGNKTRVDLRHAGWGKGADWDKAYAYFDHAWDFVLKALATRFESGPTKEQDPAPAAPNKPNLDALDRMATLIGGTWRGEVKGPDGPLKVEFTYKRHPDGKGIVGDGVIGKGSKHPLSVHSQFGWDPVAKAVYYFDTHDSETLYFGHVSTDKDDLVFTFSPVGMLPQIFQSRERLVDRDTLQAIIRDASGKDIVGFTLKRSK